MTRNSVVRYFNKTWIKMSHYRDCPTYLVTLLSGEFIIRVGQHNIWFNCWPYCWDKKYRFISYSAIKTEKELFDIIRKYGNKLAEIKREYYIKGGKCENIETI